MKTLILICLLIIRFTSFCQDIQYCNNPQCNFKDSLILSTGVNANGSLLTGLPIVDPFWKLVAIAPPFLNGQTLYINPFCPCIIEIPNAYACTTPTGQNWNYISNTGTIFPIKTSDFLFSENNTDSLQPWRFRRAFCVCQNSNLKISGNFKADDAGTVKLYNNSGILISTLVDISSYTPSNYGNDHLFSFPNISLSAGNYYLEVELANIHSIAMGFALKCSIKEINNQMTIANPSENCCQNGTISIRKILDNDCNGSWSDGDLNGANWSFSLFNSGGALVSTQQTNQWGEATFSGLQSGNYTVTEHQQSGWSSTSSQTVSIDNGGGALVTFYNCPDSSIIDLCCQIPNFNATLTGNNLNNLTLNLNSGTTQIQEVEVSMVDYHATYSEPGCQPVNMDASGGHIGYMNTTTNNLSSLNLVAVQNNSHVLEWMPGSPAQLNHTVNLSVQPPSIINVSCCSVNFSFCIKVRVKDVNCNVCEQILCFPSSSSCDCGSWNNNTINVIGIINMDSLAVQPPFDNTSRRRPVIGTPLYCGDSITLAKGEYVFSVPDYNCIPSSCNTAYQWMIQGPVSGSGTGKPFNFNFTTSGSYTVTITPFCGNRQCDPCQIKVIVPDPSCKCGSWKSSYMYLGINPQTPLSSRPFPVACGDSVKYDGPRSLHIGVGNFSCIPASCQATYKWEVSGPISGNDSGKPFDFYFSQAGTYTVTVTPYCGNQPCEPCKITVIIRPVPVTKCDCSGSGWIKDKPTLVLNESGQVAESAFNGGSITLPSPGSYQFMAPPYICNLPPPECIAGYKWEVQGPVSDSGSGSSFSYNFTQPGSYAVIITAICGNSDCPAFVFKVIIGQSCDCGKWTDNKITFNWRDRRGNQSKTIDCDNSVPYQLTDVCSNVPISGNFSDFVCIPDGCQAKYFWVVLDQNNNTVASGNDTTSTSFSFNITSGGNYQFVVTPKCGDNRCPTCRIRFSVKNVINCK